MGTARHTQEESGRLLDGLRRDSTWDWTGAALALFKSKAP